METYIDLRELLNIIKKRILIIVIMTIEAMVIGGLVSFFILNPVYETNTTILVNKDKSSENREITGDDIAVNQKLALTYGEIVKSRRVLSKVINDLNLDMTVKDLSDSIHVSSVNETEIINIVVQDTSKSRVYEIANYIVTVFTEEVERITEADSVEVIDIPIKPEKPVKPNKIMNIIISIMIGLITGIVVSFLLEHLDNKIKTESDIENKLGLNVIGTIPDENQDIKKNKETNIFSKRIKFRKEE